MDTLPSDCLVLSTKDKPHLAEMVRAMQPGEKLTLTITNGVGTVEAKYVLDEILVDRISGRVECDKVPGYEGNDDGSNQGVLQSGDETTDLSVVPGDGIGASVQSVMGMTRP